MSELDNDLRPMLLRNSRPLLPDLKLRSSEGFFPHDDVSRFREESNVDLNLTRNQQSVLRFSPEAVETREQVDGRDVERQTGERFLLNSDNNFISDGSETANGLRVIP